MAFDFRWICQSILLPFPDRLRAFIRREWTSVFVWAAVGTLCAAGLRLVRSDTKFWTYCLERYGVVSAHFEGFHAYLPFLLASLAALALAALPRMFRALSKGARSWGLGVTSGLALVSTLSSFLSYALLSSDPFRALWVDASVIGIAFWISFVLYWRSLDRARNLPSESETQVSDADMRLAGTSIPSSDDPISSWSEDLLDRAPIVNSASFSLLISRTPVLALLGAFGSGKTSILNLLARHLKDRAVVVFFSTWLPGSADTLSSYLLEDISKECRRLYFVPGIRKGARRLAVALAKRVALLDVIADLLSEATQREEIQSLADAVARLPRRVVVLLDEMDRIGKPELEALLKVLRGLSLSSNLSFVCAFDRETVERTARDTFDLSSHLYFEKFFPVSISVPVIDEDSLKTIGICRLSSALDRRGWFEGEGDRETYEAKIGELWSGLFAPFCTTIRAIGLLANDISAPAQLKGEIDLIDLTLVELLRRFEPGIHEIIWRYRETLTEGERSWARYRYRSDQQKQAEEMELRSEVDDALKDNSRAEAAKEVLGRLFPNYRKLAGLKFRLPLRGQDTDDRASTVSDPGVMRTYFHQKLGEDEFSSKQMREFVRDLERAANSEAVRSLILGMVDSMEKGDPRRKDFLAKLSAHLPGVSLSAATEVVHTCMGAAGRLAYDFFVGVGEAGDVLRMVINVAARMKDAHERAAFLGECIREAGDDTMALRILTALSKPGQDFDLQVSFASLYPCFIERMMERYGPGADPRTVNLASSDPNAFNLWGFTDLSKDGMVLDPKEAARNRATQRDFWVRYISGSRKRLAEALNRFFFFPGQYNGDPRPFIENKIPVADLRHLYASTEDDGTLTLDDHVSLRMLGRLLKGEFPDGVSPFEWENERRRTEAFEHEGDDPGAQ